MVKERVRVRNIMSKVTTGVHLTRAQETKKKKGTQAHKTESDVKVHHQEWKKKRVLYSTRLLKKHILSDEKKDGF